MLHACFTPIALCFVYISWHFYAFSRTNLLTRCHSASSCFLQFFYSRFLLKEIFSELDETKAKVPIYLTWRQSPKGRRRPARSRSHLVVARATPGPATPWCGPLGRPPTSPFRLWIHFFGKTLRARRYIHEKFHSHHRHRPEIGRVQKLFLAPCRRGKSSPRAFFIAMHASEVMCE
jgi:hypothetical protein